MKFYIGTLLRRYSWGLRLTLAYQGFKYTQDVPPNSFVFYPGSIKFGMESLLAIIFCFNFKICKILMYDGTMMKFFVFLSERA